MSISEYHIFSNVLLSLLPCAMSTSKPLHAYTSSQSPKRLQDFALNLKTALDSALPSLDPSYDKVSVIAFHWANDTMGVEPLESKLLEVFRDTYNYDIESYTIPLATSHFSLSNAINSWSFRCAGSNTLRIYVYSGHANSAGTANTSWYLGLVLVFTPPCISTN